MEIILHIVSTLALLGLIVWVCMVFTNAVEHLGKALNVGHGAVGSIFAAVGTALPETIVPLVAIIGAMLTSHNAPSGVQIGEQIGIGAILGAPFLLSTFAMCLLGFAVFAFSKHKLRESTINADYKLFLRDMKYFLTGYTIAISAGFVKIVPLKVCIGVFLLLFWGYYAYSTIAKSKEKGFEESEELKELSLARVFKIKENNFLIATQVLLSLLGLIFFAHLFVEEIKFFSDKFNINPLILSLIVAPIATELPEKVNSILWLREGKDTLALGNITGALVFQSAIPTTVGILLTPWVFDINSLANILMVYSAVLLITLTTLIAKKVVPQVLFLCGVFYLMFIGFVLLQML
ncbi:cation:H+ antiporter [Candidatus Gastranaerophilus sp. (ex Termes propinquus)]|nr:cation:H+ antiporter [Candidatus Gastranaerophilus sp. (ex Termes propinquus)]